MNAKPLLAAFSCVVVLAACSAPPSVGPSAQTSAQTSTQTSAASNMRSGVYSQNLDKTVRPQDDFYRFVNGQWLTNTAIPSDRSNYGTFALLEDGAEHDLKEILEAAAAANAPAGTDAQKVGDLYASFLDEATIESRGLTPLAAQLKRIDELKTKQDVARYIGYSQASLGGASVRVLRFGGSQELQPIHRRHHAERPGHAGP